MGSTKQLGILGQQHQVNPSLNGRTEDDLLLASGLKGA